MTPLSELLAARSWERDWPVGNRSPNALPESWGVPSCDAPDLGPIFAGGPAAPVSIQVLRQALAHLDVWNNWAASDLTFPPTTRGLAQALVKGLGSDAPLDIQEITPRLLQWYPLMAWAALDANRDLADRLPTKLREAWWPAPAAAPESASATGSNRSERSGRSRRERPTREEPRFNWLRDTVVPLAQRDGLAPLIAQEVGEAIKRHHNHTACANWGERVLLPALMTLNESDLGHVMRHWPSDLRFAVDDPVDMVKQGRFWALLRDAEPAAQARLVNDALPRVLVTDEWSAEDRLRMLRHMLGFAKNNRAAFEQRLALWQNWGGDLDERGVLSKDRAADPGNEFEVSSATKSGLDWIREQDVPIWNQWLADRFPTEPAPRRPSPRPR